MSTINKVLDLLENSEKPVLRPVHGNSGFHFFAIGLKKGMILKEHKAKWPSKLIVIQGAVSYIEGEHTNLMNAYDEQEREADVFHELIAREDSLCILTQSKPESSAIEEGADPRKNDDN